MLSIRAHIPSEFMHKSALVELEKLFIISVIWCCVSTYDKHIKPENKTQNIGTWINLTKTLVM